MSLYDYLLWCHCLHGHIHCVCWSLSHRRYQLLELKSCNENHIERVSYRRAYLKVRRNRRAHVNQIRLVDLKVDGLKAFGIVPIHHCLSHWRSRLIQKILYDLVPWWFLLHLCQNYDLLRGRTWTSGRYDPLWRCQLDCTRCYQCGGRRRW